jgi:hypothetical protein
MTASAPCPPQEDLVDLLEAPAQQNVPSALRAHVAACPQCAAHLAELQEGFAILTPLASSAPALDPAALSRLEAAVLSAMAPRREHRLIVLGLLCVAWTGLVLLVCTKVLGGAVRGSVPLTVAMTLLPAGLVPALSLSPEARRRALQLGLGAATLGVLATVHTLAPLQPIELGEFGCAVLALVTAAVPAVVLLVFAGRPAPGAGAVTGGLLGAAAFATGLAAQSALCSGDNELPHLLIGHYLPFLLGVLLLTLLVRLREPAAA